MQIGELSKKADVNIQTVRFYERQGILKPVSRRDSGYRDYDNNSLKQLKFIIQAKELGFSLKEIDELLKLRVISILGCNKVRSKAEEKLEDIKVKIKNLKRIEKNLKSLISDCNNRVISNKCPIIEKMES